MGVSDSAQRFTLAFQAITASDAFSWLVHWTVANRRFPLKSYAEIGREIRYA